MYAGDQLYLFFSEGYKAEKDKRTVVFLFSQYESVFWLLSASFKLSPHQEAAGSFFMSLLQRFEDKMFTAVIVHLLYTVPPSVSQCACGSVIIVP